MKIATVIGIRPDIVRLSAVIKRLDNDPEIEHILVHSGQHFDANLSDVFFKDLSVRAPDYNLGVGAHGKPHYQQVADLSVKLVELAHKIKPDLITFLGDSNSVLAAIPLKKEGFKIAHIEAGMRSYIDTMPEEINRIAIDHVADLLLVYHSNYRMKAMLENISPEKIRVVGNTIVEPALQIKEKLKLPGAKKHILVDIHRFENHTNKFRLEKIIEFVGAISEMTGLPAKVLEFGRTKKAVEGFGLKLKLNSEWIPLMGYKEFLQAQADSLCLVSDSGSAMEEAPLFDIPVLVPRDATERPESYDARCSFPILLKNSLEKLVPHALDFVETYHEKGHDVKWLGDGRASEYIVKEIKKFLKV